MSTKQGSGRDRTRIGRIEQIEADQMPDFQEKSVSSAQSAQSAFYFAAEYPVRLDILSLLHADLSSYFTAAVVWATMEIAVNIIEHGHPHPDPDAVFQVEATVYPDRGEIILRDRGLVFDHARLEQAVLPSDWQSHKRGGLGLSLGRRVVDELSYSREDDVNVWKIVVRSAWCVYQ